MKPEKFNKYNTYKQELTDLMVGCFNSKSIKLVCGVCGYWTIPVKDTINALYINDFGVCKHCMDKEANYESIEQNS